MGKRCCVKSCISNKVENGASMFKVPIKNTEMFIKWSFVFACEKLVLDKKSYICEKHFRSSDIIDEIKKTDKEGNIIFQVVNLLIFIFIHKLFYSYYFIIFSKNC